VKRRPTRREFLRASGSTFLGVSLAGVRTEVQRAESFDVAEKSIRELQAAMTGGRVTAEGLVELYLERIATYDQNGPRLNSVIHINPNAARDARELDAERKARGLRGPLHGIPVLLKDNFETRDMPTTGGSLALRGIVPPRDAFQVAQLRRAGAVLLGKVNLHELALGLTSVSSLGGQTLNPYDTTRTPGGSSGGSGVAAAACFAAFTLGTDTSGSIRIPSSHNSLVGLRPSAGLSSRGGIIPFGHTQDTGGPMARTVEDIAIVLDATVGYDPADPITGESGGRIPRSYTASLKDGTLKSARIGVLTEFFGTAPEDEEVAAVARRAIDEMKERGATIVDVVVPDLAKLVTAANLLTQELKVYLGNYLKNSGGYAGSIEEMLETGLHTAGIQGILELANGTADDYLSGEDYRSRLAARQTLAKAVLDLMEASRLDAIVYPTIRRIAPIVGGAQAGSNAALSANTGLPAITVPAGFTPGGFPVGIELIGRRFAESTLLALAYDYERSTRHRRPPAMSPASMSDAEPGVSVEVTAVGERAVPASRVPFQARARFTFDAPSRKLGYDIRLTGTLSDAAGVYLHRRANRQNGGVARTLATSATPSIAGTATLTEAEVSDLKAGKFYLAVLSRKSPRLSARADLAFPAV
jgi:Asp-tRNA(Asn)/Glu-tRNA(Gln) amidotransferase A subunit family amidase